MELFQAKNRKADKIPVERSRPGASAQGGDDWRVKQVL
jgi:hypothetical protein